MSLHSQSISLAAPTAGAAGMTTSIASTQHVNATSSTSLALPSVASASPSVSPALPIVGIASLPPPASLVPAAHQHPIPLRTIICNFVHAAHDEVMDVIDSFTSAHHNDHSRRVRLYTTVTAQMAALTRILLLTQHAITTAAVHSRIDDANSVIQHRQQLLNHTVHSMHILTHHIQSLATPQSDITTAIHTLSTGDYQLLPKCIDRSIIGNQVDMIMTKSLRQSTMRRLNDALYCRLLADAPAHYTHIHVFEGIAYLSTRELTVGVSLRMTPQQNPPVTDDKRINWRLFELYFNLNAEAHTPTATQPSSSSRTSIVSDFHCSHLIALCNSKMFGHQQPLTILYEIVHEFTMTVTMNVLISQAKALKVLHDVVIDTKEMNKLIVTYWPQATLIPSTQRRLLNTAITTNTTATTSSSSSTTKTAVTSNNKNASILTISIEQKEMNIQHLPLLTDMTEHYHEFLIDPSCISLPKLFARIIQCHAEYKLKQFELWIRALFTTKRPTTSTLAGIASPSLSSSSLSSPSLSSSSSVLSDVNIDQIFFLRDVSSIDEETTNNKALFIPLLPTHAILARIDISTGRIHFDWYTSTVPHTQSLPSKISQQSSTAPLASLSSSLSSNTNQNSFTILPTSSSYELYRLLSMEQARVQQSVLSFPYSMIRLRNLLLIQKLQSLISFMNIGVTVLRRLPLIWPAHITNPAKMLTTANTTTSQQTSALQQQQNALHLYIRLNVSSAFYLLIVIHPQSDSLKTVSFDPMSSSSSSLTPLSISSSSNGMIHTESFTFSYYLLHSDLLDSPSPDDRDLRGRKMKTSMLTVVSCQSLSSTDILDQVKRDKHNHQTHMNDEQDSHHHTHHHHLYDNVFGDDNINFIPTVVRYCEQRVPLATLINQFVNQTMQHQIVQQDFDKMTVTMPWPPNRAATATNSSPSSAPAAAATPSVKLHITVLTQGQMAQTHSDTFHLVNTMSQRLRSSRMDESIYGSETLCWLVAIEESNLDKMHHNLNKTQQQANVNQTINSYHSGMTNIQPLWLQHANSSSSSSQDHNKLDSAIYTQHFVLIYDSIHPNSIMTLINELTRLFFMMQFALPIMEQRIHTMISSAVTASDSHDSTRVKEENSGERFGADAYVLKALSIYSFVIHYRAERSNKPRSVNGNVNGIKTDVALNGDGTNMAAHNTFSHQNGIKSEDHSRDQSTGLSDINDLDTEIIIRFDESTTERGRSSFHLFMQPLHQPVLSSSSSSSTSSSTPNAFSVPHLQYLQSELNQRDLPRLLTHIHWSNRTMRILTWFERHSAYIDSQRGINHAAFFHSPLKLQSSFQTVTMIAESSNRIRLYYRNSTTTRIDIRMNNANYVLIGYQDNPYESVMATSGSSLSSQMNGHTSTHHHHEEMLRLRRVSCDDLLDALQAWYEYAAQCDQQRWVENAIESGRIHAIGLEMTTLNPIKPTCTISWSSSRRHQQLSASFALSFNLPSLFTLRWGTSDLKPIHQRIMERFYKEYIQSIPFTGESLGWFIKFFTISSAMQTQLIDVIEYQLDQPTILDTHHQQNDYIHDHQRHLLQIRLVTHLRGPFDLDYETTTATLFIVVQFVDLISCSSVYLCLSYSLQTRLIHYWECPLLLTPQRPSTIGKKQIRLFNITNEWSAQYNTNGFERLLDGLRVISRMDIESLGEWMVASQAYGSNVNARVSSASVSNSNNPNSHSTGLPLTPKTNDDHLHPADGTPSSAPNTNNQHQLSDANTANNHKSPIPTLT